MMLSVYLDERKVLLNVEERSYRGLLKKMLERSVEQDAEPIIEMILEREKIMPTILGKGIFLPRVVLKEKNKSEVIIAISPTGITFEDYGAVPASIVMLFLFAQQDDHPAILAQSLRLLTDDSLRSDLLTSKKPKDIIKAIRKWEEE